MYNLVQVSMFETPHASSVCLLMYAYSVIQLDAALLQSHMVRESSEHGLQFVVLSEAS